MKPKYRIAHPLAALSALALLGGTATLHAVPYTWNGATALWNSSNWSTTGGPGPFVAGPTGNSNADSANISAGTVSFAVNDTFGNNATTSSPVITVNSGGTLASGGFFNTIWDLNLSGGTVALTGGANPTFPTFQFGGTLTATGTSNINVVSGTNNAINIGAQGNATLIMNVVGASDVLNVNTALQNSQILSGTQTSSLTKNGAGTLNLTATNSFTGITTVNAGILSTNAPNTATGALGSSSSIVVNNGGTINVIGTNSFTGIAGTGTIQINAGGTVNSPTFTTNHLEALILNGGTLSAASPNNTYGNWNFDQGVSTLGNGSTSSITGGNAALTQTGGTVFNIGTGDTVNVSTILANTGLITSLALNKTGAGTLNLSGANNYTSATTISGGTLSAGVASVANVSGAFGKNSAVSLTNTASTVMNLAGFNTQIGSLTGGGLTGGNVTLGAATLTLGGDNTSPPAYAGIISGTGGLTKIGTGTQILSGTNSYNGTTLVTAGTLLINGSISTSVTVQTGATLGGSGSVGALTINSGGTLAPGNSPGMITTGNYIQNGTLSLELNGTVVGSGYDQVNVAGTVSLTGALAATVGFTPANGTLFFIVNNDNADAVTGNFAGLAQGAIVNFNGNNFQISYTANNIATPSFLGGNDVALMAVPEPNVAMLVGGFGVLALLRRRRN